MPFLRKGASGAEVVKLQEGLQGLGFNPGKIDGVFGPATAQAVKAFQKSRGLEADAVVGPITLGALESELAARVPWTISRVTVEMVAKMFPFTPLNHIRENLPYVLKALEEANLADKSMVLMALATIRAESEGFEPIGEYISKWNTSPGGHPFDQYDYKNGNQGPPDGESFKGRGFVQLTGRFNYQKYGEAMALGNKLLEDPDLANDPEIAAQLLAKFLADQETEIREALGEGNLKTARRLVNGGAHGLERFTEAYHIGEKLLA